MEQKLGVITCLLYTSIVKRSQGQSAVAGAAYQSGERLFSDYDQKTKFYNKKKDVYKRQISDRPAQRKAVFSLHRVCTGQALF